MSNVDRNKRIKLKEDQNQKYEIMGQQKEDNRKNPLLDQNGNIRMNVINQYDGYDDILDNIDYE